MSRSFVWLFTVALGVGTLGCSDPVPAAAAVGLRLNITQSGSCTTMNELSDDIGAPPPDKDRIGADPKKGRPVFDGDSGLNARCRVAGEGPYTFTASVRATAGAKSGSVTMTIVEGQMSANGAGTARMSFVSAAGPGSIGNGTCSLTAVPTSEGPGVKAGALWATFQCTGLTQDNTPSVNCSANGEVLLENCSQNE